MATALTLVATNPLANPLNSSNYGVRRKSSMTVDGASVYPRKNSINPPSSPLAKHTYSVLSPVLVVKPSIPRSPLLAKPSLPSSPRQPQPALANNDATSTTTNTLKLSYAEVLKSSGNLNLSGNTLKSSGNSKPATNNTTSPVTSPSLTNGKQRKSRMDKKLDFEVEKAKLKARRMAKKGFERQTGKAWDNDLTKQEWEIYQAQVKRHEEALLQQKQEEEAAAILAANIKHKEIVLQQLQTDLASKQKQIEEGQGELERFRTDFEESLKEQFPSSSTAEKSADVRMREEQAKKKLRAAWRNNGNPDDPVQQTRRNILIAQEDVASLNIRITHLKKELAKMKEIAAREASSKVIMRDEKRRREEMKRQGIERPKAEPKPKPPPPAPVLRSHQMRMAEQQALKAKARAARLSSGSSSSPSYPSSSAPVSSSSSSSSSSSKSR